MTPNQYLEPLFFFQLIVTSVFTARNSFPPPDCPTVHLSPRLHPSPPRLSTIVAISRLFCMDFDCSQGAILHVAQSSHTNTHAQTCMRRRGGERGGKKLAFRGFVYQMCCQIMSGISHQGTFSSLGLLKRKDSNTRTPQCNLHNFPHCIFFIF